VTRRFDDRLEALFVRYWDDTLTDAEGAELADRLRADAGAREAFRLLNLHAVVAAEQTTLPRLARAESARRTGRWSRRRVLQYVGAGLAAGVAGVAGWRFWDEPAEAIRLAAVRGSVQLSAAGRGLTARAGGTVPAGATVTTYGPGSSALLAYPDGSNLTLVGDSSLFVAPSNRQLVLQRGNANAEIRPQPAGAPGLVLATTLAALTTASGAVVGLGRASRATEVGVADGRVSVSAPSGESFGVVPAGELLTVRADGDRRKQPIPATPDDFALDLSRPLSEDWHVGRREVTAAGPVLRPELWFDPYHKAEMYQVRSDNQWARGFFRLLPDSVVRVRYQVERPGLGQVVLCVRSDHQPDAETGVVEYTGPLTPARDGSSHWLEVRANDMVDNKEAPRFGAPWIGFLMIFNTYRADLGLKVLDFRVARPGGAAR
jgi:ferric-dicitrate binding protein FerR (iron transport regulator)